MGKELFKIGTLSLDPASHILSGPRGKIRLAPKIFSTLMPLMRREGVIVPDSELISHVWPNPDDEPECPELTIKANIKHLRGTFELLGAGGSRKVKIRREYSAGYFVELGSNRNND